ncbi:MAG: hypothetical protein ACRDON_12495 [Gaiellaceae bacterium]
MTAERNEPDIDYDGRIYVRPVGRGVTMIDLVGSPELDELIEEGVAELHGVVSGWTGRARVRVEILDELPGWDGRIS